MVKSPVEGGDLGVKSKIELRQVKSNKKQKTTDKEVEESIKKDRITSKNLKLKVENFFLLLKMSLKFKDY